MRLMLMDWLKAKDAVEAGCALADSFPFQSAGTASREFIDRTAQQLRALKLNFYRRVIFANSFRLRLQERGVETELAHDITQTLLANALVPGANSTAATTAPRESQLSISGQSLDAHLRQAAESFGRGAYEEAVAHYRRYVAARPRDSAAFNGLGAALTRLGRLEQAREQFHTAIALEPRNADALCNLGGLFMTHGRHADAENFFRRATKLRPTDSLYRASLGQALANQGLVEKARVEFNKVLRTAPRYAPALVGLGTVERVAGRFAEAEQMLWRALEVDSNLPSAWTGIAASRRMTAADCAWLAGAEKAASNTTAVSDEADVRFAIGKYFDDLGEYARAFSSYRRANELLKPLATPYDHRAHARFVDDLAHLYTPEALARARATGVSSTRPVFVVGMPRSGTSLVEQILASHPAVSGGGELDFWTDLVRRDEAQVRKSLLSESSRQKIASDYLAVLRSCDADAGYVVDKMPRNADYLGLIHSVFPDARFIYMRRDPIDTCLSCYFQNFSLSLNFKFDLADLAHHYREHARLMAHWRKVLPPGTMLDVPYEELVANQEHWTRTILGFLGLEWDERCLKFTESSRPVLTASSWQVRQPVYGGSVRRWRNYSQFVAPLRNLQQA